MQLGGQARAVASSGARRAAIAQQTKLPWRRPYREGRQILRSELSVQSGSAAFAKHARTWPGWVVRLRRIMCGLVLPSSRAWEGGRGGKKHVGGGERRQAWLAGEGRALGCLCRPQERKGGRGQRQQVHAAGFSGGKARHPPRWCSCRCTAAVRG